MADAASNASASEDVTVVLGKIRVTLVHLEQTLSRIASASSKQLPDFARVVIRASPEAPEAIGQKGVVVGSAKPEGGEWMYNVLVETLREAFFLPSSALEFGGEVAKRGEIYGTRRRRAAGATGRKIPSSARRSARG
ncbi:MAG TPA: hypothetical protein VIM11_23850 [Tepidisphaeraceae bacterium]|jgi:hypothetical protein